MAVKIIEPKSIRSKIPPECPCEILADTEADITALTETVTDGRMTVKPAPGSYACTADGSAKYILSPSNVWTKVGG